MRCIPGNIVALDECGRDFGHFGIVIGPFFFTYQSDAGGLLSVKLASANLSRGTMKGIFSKMEALFARSYPKEQFNSRFFDESIARLYKRENQKARMVNIGMSKLYALLR